MKKSKLSPLLEYINLHNEKVSDEARRLQPIAKELGIETTLNSILLFIIRARRKATPEIKYETLEPTKTEISVEALNAIITSLEDLRDYITYVEHENQMLRNKMTSVLRAAKE
jgi:hypothetical protein